MLLFRRRQLCLIYHSFHPQVFPQIILHEIHYEKKNFLKKENCVGDVLSDFAIASGDSQARFSEKLWMNIFGRRGNIQYEK